MTRRSKREIERDVDALTDGRQGGLDGEDMWVWIRALSDPERDVGRPPEFFADDVEWCDELEDIKETAAERVPPLAYLSPPEVYVLSYMDDDTIESLLDVLKRAEDSAVHQFFEATSKLTERSEQQQAEREGDR